MGGGESAARPRASEMTSILNLSEPPVPLWNSNTGALFVLQTQLTRVSAAHQYCYLHRVSICGPYNHKMLIAPINSQSVCALVWPPRALKVSLKMNCSLILLQEKIFSQDNRVCCSEIKRRSPPLSFLSFPVSSS